MTLYFSTLRYNLLDPDSYGFVGLAELYRLSLPIRLSSPRSSTR